MRISSSTLNEEGSPGVCYPAVSHERVARMPDSGSATRSGLSVKQMWLAERLSNRRLCLPPVWILVR